MDEVMDTIRKEVENTDFAQGIKMLHSLGGGTGSGLGTLLVSRIRDDYPDITVCTYSICPYISVTSSVVEPYNAVFALHELLDNADQTFIIQNEACFNICRNILKQKIPKHADLNWIISLTMTDVTALWRYPTQLNRDFRRLGINLVNSISISFCIINIKNM